MSAYSKRQALFGMDPDRPADLLEEIDDGELVVRISATPVKREDGPALADQVVTALDRVHTAQQAG